MEVVLKSKGQKDECNNSRGICLLAATGKVLSRIVLDRLQIYVANEILLNHKADSEMVGLQFTRSSLHDKKSVWNSK